MLFFALTESSPFIFQIFENNLLNWIALIALIIWLTAKYVPSLLDLRQQQINAALKTASEEKKHAQIFFEQQKTRVANAEQDAKNILVEARQMADQLHNEAIEQAKKDLVHLKHKIELSIANEQRQAITQMRGIASKAAIQLTQEAIPAAITDSIKTRLMSQFLDQLEVSKT